MWTRNKDTIGVYVQSSITFWGGLISSLLSLTTEDKPSGGHWTGLMCPNVNSEVQVRLWVRLCIIPRVVELFVCVSMWERERLWLPPGSVAPIKKWQKQAIEKMDWKWESTSGWDIKKKLTFVLRRVQKAERLHPSSWFSSFEGLFWRWAVELLSRWLITESGHNSD